MSSSHTQDIAVNACVQSSNSHQENDRLESSIVKPKLSCEVVENPDYSWMRRLVRLQKAYVIRVNQTQYELACLSTMGGAYSICRYPKEALQIAKRQELIGIRMGSKQVQCHAKLYQYINLIFMGRKKAGLRMLEAAKEQANELESDSVRKHCDVTENWLKNEIKYKYSHKGGTDPKVNKLVTPNVQLLK
mmetsp:Transcript_6686/g.12883  ORF Transcript_6686/g.12883 Transcript_6686/m.12883 type:complete len:190 (-) Transcript_6686:1743-2312(-)